MTIAALETPALLLRADILDRNIARMQSQVAHHGVALRPHMKTSKNIDILRRFDVAGQKAITVSTLREAVYFADHGVRDILYAVGIVSEKLSAIARIRQRGTRVSVILDSIEAAQAVADEARRLKIALPVLIEIDCDGNRSGVPADDPALIEIARTLANASNTELQGVMTHAGSSYRCLDPAATRRVAAQERAAAVDAARRLRLAGLPCPTVSIGSTPTALYAEDLSEVTEVRAGVFVFFDLGMARLGVCTLDDIALSVLVAVIGKTRQGRLVTDGGWTALSRDRGAASSSRDDGYGLVCDEQGRLINDLIVSDVNQEHGLVASRSGAAIDMRAFSVGRRLRILPNHACATAAQHEQYQVLAKNGEILASWERC